MHIESKSRQDKPLANSVAVIGGGLAGISTALALRKFSESKVTLFESKRRLGGRTGSFETGEHSNSSIDYCQHVGMGCCTNLRQLISWLNQDDLWLEERQLNFFNRKGQQQTLRALPILPAPLHLTHWLVRWPELQMKDRLSIARGMLAINSVQLNPESETTSAIEWLRSKSQTPAAIEIFWRTIIVSALGEELDQVSLSSVAKVLQDGFLRHREAFHLLIPQAPLDDLFNTRAKHVLESFGVDVHLQSPVKQVAHHSGRFELTLNDGNSHKFEQLVISVPWHQIGKLTPTSDSLEWIDKLGTDARQLGQSPITGIHTWWDREWFQLRHAALVGGICQWIFKHPTPFQSTSVHSNEDRLKYLQIVVSASHDLSEMSHSEIRLAILEDLRQVFPQVAEAKLEKFRVVTDPWAVFSIGPGTHLVRPHTIPDEAPPGCFLAGDWTRTGWPATMEGAIASGFRAAEHALNMHDQIAARPLR